MTKRMATTGISSPFDQLEHAVSALETYLRGQAFDYSPLILSQPPSKREARRLDLQNVLAPLKQQMSRIVELHKRMTAIRDDLTRLHSMCHTALSPISALPHELLRRVFQYARMGSSLFPEWSARVAYSIRQVSRDWQAVALSIPSFCSYKVDCISMIPSLANTLVKVAHSPCLVVDTIVGHSTIGGHSTVLSVRVDDECGLDSLRANLAHIRWKSANDIYALFALIGGSSWPIVLPSLQSLEVYGDISINDAVELTIGDVEFPKLESLLLNYASLGSFKAKLPASVVKLTLTCIHISRTDFKKLLLDDSKLRFISIDASECSFTDIVRLSDNSKKLPYLEELFIGNSSQAIPHYILKHWQCPSLRVLRLTLKNLKHEPMSSPWSNNPSHNARTVASSLSNCIFSAVRPFLFLDTRMSSYDVH